MRPVGPVWTTACRRSPGSRRPPGSRPIDRLLLGLVLAISLYAFDDLALSTILPTVAHDLAGDRYYEASFLAFLLTNLASLVASGYFIDRIGMARPFAAGMAVFVAGLALGCLAPSMPVFVLGRALQGLGGGAIQAVVSAALVIAWRGAARQRAISWVTTAWMVPALVGPFVAGWITQAFAWRYVFAGLIAIACVTTVTALPRLARVSPTSADATDHEALPLAAVTAAAGVALGAGLVLYGLDQGGMAGVAILLGGCLVLRQPLRYSLPRGYLSGASPLGALLLFRMLACAVFFGIEAWLPWTAVRSGLATPMLAGLVLSSAALGWTATTWWVDRVIARIAPRSLLALACVCLLGGTLIAWYAAAHAPAVPPLFVAWAVAGAAMGLVYPVVSRLAMARAERGREGHLSMMLGLSDTLGITGAIGLGGAWLRVDAPDALARIGGLWLGFVALAALLPLLLLVRRQHFELTRDG